MDFPAFHLDFLGNRLLIALIAIIHVFHSHPLAVGSLPLIALMEWWGRRTNNPQWDRLAYRILFVCFILTTSVGALTGVGIWLSASLVNPDAIGSLIRVFFWAWFVEWIVFVSEVLFILLYFLTWKRMEGKWKPLHIAMGIALGLFSWFTMAIIAAILGFMADPGNWMTRPTFLNAIFNPVYLPQLAFRTALAMITGGCFALFLTYFFTRDSREVRSRATRWVSTWVLFWLPLAVVGSLWYRHVLPTWMLDNLPVALATTQFTQWYSTLSGILAALVVTVVLVATWGVLKPQWLPRVALLAPFVVGLLMIGTYERAREFTRKPYVIANYMYANGIRVSDYPLLQEEGVLRHATYVSTRDITPDTMQQAGEDLFRITCTRCHTVSGVNSITDRLTAMYGPSPWDPDVLRGYILIMHNTRPFMPPFPGTNEEAGALAEYLVAMQQSPRPLGGAQSVGISLPPPSTGSISN